MNREAYASNYEYVKELAEWSDRCWRSGFPLGKNEVSRMHQLYEAIATGNIVGVEPKRKLSNEALENFQVFLFEQDWASLLGDVIESDDDVRLPYENCVFEFIIGGRPVISIWSTHDEPPGEHHLCFFKTRTNWVCAPDQKAGEFHTFIDRQVRAMCVVLDAEVATAEVVRAPHSLNSKRKKTGKLPISDHHIVRLSNRHGSDAPARGTHRSPRLHFRRGHWRHYDGHKTWIKWMLVGDPDLGSITKHYVL